MKVTIEGKYMSVQSLQGPMTVVEKCIYKPEWSAWEKLLVIPLGTTYQISDTFWNLFGYDTEAQARAANPEFADPAVFEIGCPF
jgi:hypothetical protein